MKLIEIYKRLGKQPLQVTRHKDAVVFVNGEKYKITGVIYNSGRFIGFTTDTIWYPEDIKPKANKWVVVKDKNGKEYDYHQWAGHAWYAYVHEDDDTYDGWRSDVDIVSWRYQD